MKLKTSLIALLLMASPLLGQTITTNTNNLTTPWSNSFNSFQGQPSVSLAFRVTASNLTTNITVALSDSTNWQVSTNNTAFTNTVLMSSNSSNALLWVRMTGSNIGTFTNTVSLTSDGAATNTTTITGTVVQSLTALMYNRFSGNAVYTNTNTLTFTNVLGFGTNSVAATRTNLGLGSGITTNITFVDLNTNTNSVTISNGIITGWTQ